MSEFGSFSLNSILDTLGHTEEAKHFANDLLRHLRFDRNYQEVDGYARPNPEQHAILEKIAKGCDNFLAPLRSIRKHERDGDHIQIKDFYTPILIQDSLWLLKREKRLQREKKIQESPPVDPLTLIVNATATLSEVIESIKENASSQHDSNSDSHVNVCDIEGYDYPNSVIEAVEEFQEAVLRAAKKIGNARGNSSGRVSTQIRKKSLAENFIRSYQKCFNQYPPETSNVNNKVYGLFVDYLSAAGLTNKDTAEKYSFKMAIEWHKKIYGPYVQWTNRMLAKSESSQGIVVLRRTDAETF